MEVTKNDLCSNSATLDYQALLRTAQSAYKLGLEEVSRHLSVLHRFPPCGNTERYLHAGWLAQEAKTLVVVAETLSTLLEGLTREEISIVNREVRRT